MPTTLNADERTCPYCAETIKAAARVCRYCNRDVSVGASPRAATDRPTEKPKNALTTPLSGATTAIIFIGLALWLGSNFLGAMDKASHGSSPDSYSSISSIASVSVDSVPDISIAAASNAASNNVDLQPKKVKSLAEGKIGQPVLAGEVVNTSGKTLRYLEANAEFTDKKGKVVATGMDNSGDTLAPGQKWRFEVMWPQGASSASGSIVSVKGTYQ